MSNKILVIIIILIILAGAGIAAYFYWQQTKPLRIPPAEVSDSQQNADQPTPAPSPTPSQATPAPVEQNGQCKNDFDPNKLKANANMNISNRQVVIVVKDFGTITLQFYDKDAPKAVENFLRLADAGYYDCLTFHRIAQNFVVQGGDPSGTGSGGQSAFGAPFVDELNPVTASYKAGYLKGVLAMANSGPNTNGSQFFIMLADNQLQHNYTIFGKVISGLDVVDKIGQVAINPVMGPTDGPPKTPVIMTSVKIIK